MSSLRIAIQKSGRLTEASRKLIADGGIEVEQVGQIPRRGILRLYYFQLHCM